MRETLPSIFMLIRSNLNRIFCKQINTARLKANVRILKLNAQSYTI